MHRNEILMRMTRIEQYYEESLRTKNPIKRFLLHLKMKSIFDEVAEHHPELVHDFLQHRMQEAPKKR